MSAANDFEALNWLANQAIEESGFASNRFNTLEDARVFVRELYALGATRVEIAEESLDWEEQLWSQNLVPYADAIKVFFEPNSQRSEHILQFCLKELSNGTWFTAGTRSLSAEEVVPLGSAEGYIELWWD